MERPKLLSLFTGAGGLDLGLEASGYEIIGAVEMDSTARTCLAANKSWPLLGDGDINSMSPIETMKALGLKPGELDLLSAGPPCQPFSRASAWSTGSVPGLRDPRANTIASLFAHIAEIKPRAIIIENVTSALTLTNRKLLKRTFRELNTSQGTNYVPHMLKLNANDYGVPQARRRTFLVAMKDGSDFSMKTPEQFGIDRLIMNAWDAIGDLNEIRHDDLTIQGFWSDLMPSIPEGWNYNWHTPKGDGQPIFGYRRRFWSFLLKLAKDRPSWTIQASPGPSTGPFHWKNRRLSILELARLQTFPDGYVFPGNYRAAQRLIGNAVPALLAEAIGVSLLNINSKPLQYEFQYLGKKNSKASTPECIRDAPAKYLDLSLETSDHPGEGKGPLYQLTTL